LTSKKYTKEDYEIYFIFEDNDYVHVLWSKNADPGDVPDTFPTTLNTPNQPGVIQALNLTKIMCLQQSYCWQPHLPFMPVHLPSDPWALHYKYKYDTLPIIQVALNEWTLEESLAQSWSGHVTFFTEILSTWCSHLAMAPMSVDYIPDIRTYNIWKQFDTENKAQGYFWHYRTLIFSMYAEFAFVTAGRPKWREQIDKFCKEKCLNLSEAWLAAVESSLCDFWHTKRAGVIIDVATTQLWPFLHRYHENGIPTLMDVGHVLFHDHDDQPKLPTIAILKVTGINKYDVYPSEWPSQPELVARTRQILQEYYWNRLGTFPRSSIVPLTLSRPLVEESGGVIHQRCATSAWVDPQTHESVDFMQMAAPQPIKGRCSEDAIDWVEFFQRCNKVNQKMEERETPMDKIRQQSHLKDALKINQAHSSGPMKKSTVYRWVQDETPPAGLRQQDNWVPLWRRVHVV